MAFFSDSRATFFRRFSDAFGVRYRISLRMWCVSSLDRGQRAIGLPGRLQLALVHLAGRAAQSGGDVGGDLVEPHEPLAGLLGVVEGMGMEEGPDELPAHVLQPELEVRVLVDRVMPRLEGQRTDGVALAGGDLLGPDHARRVAGPGGGDRAVVGTVPRVAQGDDGGTGAKGRIHERVVKTSRRGPAAARRGGVVESAHP